MDNAGLVAIAFLLVVLNGFFVAAEFAMVKLRPTRVEELRKLHGRRGRVLVIVHGKLDAYLSACQLGITLASLGLGWIGEPAFARLIEGPAHWLGWDQDPALVKSVAFAFAFTLISFLHIVVGELAPKSLAIRMSDTVSLWTAVPLWVFYWTMYPFIWVLNASANLTLRLVGLNTATDHSMQTPYSREELRSILHISRPLSEGQERTIASVASHALELPDLHVSDLMRPPREMASIELGASRESVLETIKRYRYSRFPVRRIGHEIVGILHVKELLQADAGEAFATQLLASLRQPLHLQENESAAVALKRFQRGQSHFGIVHDSEGGIAGFLTLEDVLEAVFGEITDEYERSRDSQIRRNPQWIGDAVLAVQGDTALFRIEREIGRTIQMSNEVGTVYGLMMKILDRVPSAGDFVEHDGLRLEAVRASGHRLESVNVTSIDPGRAMTPGALHVSKAE